MTANRCIFFVVTATSQPLSNLREFFLYSRPDKYSLTKFVLHYLALAYFREKLWLSLPLQIYFYQIYARGTAIKTTYSRQRRF